MLVFARPPPTFEVYNRSLIDLEGITLTAHNQQPALALLLFFNGSADEGKKKFSAFYDVGPVADMTREMPYSALNGILVCYLWLHVLNKS
jgi:hypothetical protein